MKLKLTWLLTLCMAFVMQFSFAQEKTVTGTVTTKSDGLPLPGASVIVKGTSKGQQTDFDGKYTIQVNQGDVLVISYVGMTPGEVTIGAGSTYDVALEDANVLDEVVVVGYGTTTKESFTGSAASVDVQAIEEKVVSNVTQALRGEVAGVNIVARTGAPGATAEVRIRGFGSINGNTLPLYIVDGAPLSDNDTSFNNYGVLSAINPADIESMTVLKDAAATSIYGSRGANGVVIITTKKGKAGSSRISVDVSTSINTLLLPQYNTVTSPEEYMELSWSALRNKGQLLGQANPAQWASSNLYGDPGVLTEAIDPTYNIWNVPGDQLINPATGRFNSGVQRRFDPTPWSDIAIGTGVRTEANLQFSGGTEKTTFSTSFGYVDDEGYAVNSKYSRYSARINVTHKAKDWLTIGGNMAYTGARAQQSSNVEGDDDGRSSGDIFDLVNTVPAIYDIYLRDANGELVSDPIFGGSQYDYGNATGRRAWNGTNGVADAVYDLSRNDISTLLGNFNIDIDITKWLSFETRYSGQFQLNEDISRSNPYYGGRAESGGTLYVVDDEFTNQNFMQLLRFNKTFGEHNFEMFVAHESTEDRWKRMFGAAQRAIDPNSVDLNQYTTPIGRAETWTRGWTLDSYFSQLSYDYAGKYFLTGSIRRDGSSRFLNDKWGTFGSVGAGWILTKEDFLSNVSFIDFLKLKASYGVIGDSGNQLLNGWQSLNINQTVDGSYSFTPTNTEVNPELTWETSNIWQVGFESTLFDGLLDVDVEYYNKKTTNLFFTENLAGSSGFQFFTYNGGELENKGLEFNVKANIIKNNEDFRLSLGINGEMMTNQITEMPTPRGADEALVFDDFNNLAVGFGNYDWFMREWAGVDPGNGAALWNMYYDDLDNDGLFNNDDVIINNLVTYQDANPDAQVEKTVTDIRANATQKFIGKSAIPKVRGGFRLNTGFKNFDLSAQFSYSLGGYAYDTGYAVLMDNSLIGTDNYHTDIRDAWQGPGDITNVPRMSAGFDQDGNQNLGSTRFLTKSDFLALNNINLNYRFPQAVVEDMGMTSLSLFVSGDNLMMLSARKGFNPSTVIASTNAGTYSPLTTFSLGAKIQF